MSDMRLTGLAHSLLVELHEPYHLHERLEIAIKYLKAASGLHDCDSPALYGEDECTSCGWIDPAFIRGINHGLKQADKELLVQTDSTVPSEGIDTGSSPVEFSNNTTSYLSHDITFTPTITQVTVSSCGVEGCSVAPWSNE